MSVTSANTKLVNIPAKKVDSFFRSLMKTGIDFEVLDPKDLGKKWETVSYYKIEDSLVASQKLSQIDDILLKNSRKKSFLESFADDRIEVSLEELDGIEKEKDSLNELIDQISKLNQKIDLLKADSEDDKVQIQDQVDNLKDSLKEALEEDFYLNAATKKQLTLLYGYYQLQAKTEEIRSKAFRLNEKTEATFAFVAVKEKDLSTLDQFLAKEEVFGENVDWDKDIVDWTNPGALKSFQDVAQSIGTIDKKEADPTSGLAIFFMVFFAFCLGDAIYGLIIALFTGYFLFIRGVKQNFKGIFNIFFYSSLIAIILGVVTNSWAGDFFNSSLVKQLFGISTDSSTSTPINDILVNFQLIDVLNADAKVPVNQMLSGTSPIIVMMLLAGFIGFLNQLLGYVYRIITNAANGAWNVVFGQLAWLLFLSVSIAVLIINSSAPNLGSIAMIGLYISLGVLFILNQADSFAGKTLGFLLGPRGIYGILQLGSNLISYVRIVAIGLTGSIIANIVNLLAGLMYESSGPVLGIILAIIILVIGHIFNFVLAAFGAYINPLRLTYVEFMPGFFEGNGKQLESARPEFKHLKIVSEGEINS
jgi:V/A-type H+-transporting ATPase subunit I